MVPKITSFKFGKICIDGHEYTSDVILFPEGIFHPWWRKQGHRVVFRDVEKVLQRAPQVVIFGTGTSELVKVDPEVITMLEELGARVILAPTGEACRRYNNCCDKEATVACLHLTC